MTNLRYRRIWICFVMILMVFAFCNVAQARSVFPGAVGFGTETIAGRGGQVIRVTNLNASGPGSLKAAIDTSGPRVVVFEVSGTIQVDSKLTISNPYITIAGQTAPSPGITLRGATLCVRTHDVLIQHIRIRVGNQGGCWYKTRDGIDMGGPNVHNLVIDHCSVSWATDENISVWPGSKQGYDITISNCIISEGIPDPDRPGTIGLGMLIGSNADRVSVIGDLFVHNKNRNPATVAKGTAVINNLIYNSGWFGVRAEDLNDGNAFEVSIVGNVVIPGLNSGSYVNYAVSLRNEWAHAGSGSHVYVSDNECVNRTSDPWSAVDDREGHKDKVKVDSPPLWPTGLIAKPSSEVKASVLANAGARPADRDSVDLRVVKDVRQGTGRFINSQNDVGGWPKLAKNRRALTLPNNPNGDDDRDGYTNLEEWLYTLAASVEGKEQGSVAISSPKNVHIMETSN